ALLKRFAHPEHHCRRGAHAELVSSAMHADPIFGAALETGNTEPHIIVEDLGAAARNGIKSGIVQPRNGGAKVQVAVFGDGQHLGGGKAMQPDLRKALLDAGEVALEPIDLKIGVNATLHQDASAAHFDGFGDFFADLFEIEDISLVRLRAFQWAVKGAEGAVLGAEVRVIDVAVDDVSDHAFRVQAPPHGVGLEAQANQVGRAETVECLLARDRHHFNFSNLAYGRLSIAGRPCRHARAQALLGIVAPVFAIEPYE